MGTKYGLGSYGWISSRRGLSNISIQMQSPRVLSSYFWMVIAPIINRKSSVSRWNTTVLYFACFYTPRMSRSHWMLVFSLLLKYSGARFATISIKKTPGKLSINSTSLSLFSQAWHMAVNPINIMAGFRKAGVFPFDPEALSILATADNETELQRSEGETLTQSVASKSLAVTVDETSSDEVMGGCWWWHLLSHD